MATMRRRGSPSGCGSNSVTKCSLDDRHAPGGDKRLLLLILWRGATFVRESVPPLESFHPSVWCEAYVPALIPRQRNRHQNIRPYDSIRHPRLASDSIERPLQRLIPLYLFADITEPITPSKAFDTSGTSTVKSITTVDSDTSISSEPNAVYLAAAARLQAAQLRLDAERLDRELSQSKLIKLQNQLSKLQRELVTSRRTADMPAQMERVRAQIQMLQQKLGLPTTSPETGRIAIPGDTGTISLGIETVMTTSIASDAMIDERRVEASSQSTRHSTETKNSKDDIVAGFDQADLDLYIPVAIRLYEQMPDATADERLEAFREAPELQENFSAKLTKLLLGPMQDMQRLEELKDKYLASNSSKEKDQLKREIDSLTKSLEQDGPFSYSDSIYFGTPPLDDAALQAQIDVVETLPEILQTLYKKRHELDSDASLELAVWLEHYETQLQLLEQVQLIGEKPLPPSIRAEVVQALESLPVSVRNHVAESLDLDPNEYTMDELVVALCKSDDDDDEGVSFDWNPLKQVAIATSTPMDQSDEYEDITFIDRSRYLQEFFPAVARMEGQHPKLETVEAFTKWLAQDKRTFMANSKPERVVGGYYVRGQNLVDAYDAESGAKLVHRLQTRIRDERHEGQSNAIHDQLEYFYILDPSPQTDEEVELELRRDPVLLVTGRNATLFYNYASPGTKLAVTSLSLLTMAGFSLGVCALEPPMREQMEAAWALLSAGESVALDWLWGNVSQLVLSLLTIQAAHEAGHRVVAWRDKFDIGLPTMLPSIQLGLFGAITPISSPPDLKSMFDFGVAGPVAGMVMSLVFFLCGLTATASLDFNELTLLPALPIDLLRSSALGGGLIELFLGKGTLTTNVAESNSVLALHPLAIAGFIGALGNALALLPIGNTDGGRVSLAMFRRRGAYVVQVFTTSLLCIAGLLGFDDMGVLLTYTLFAVACQAELETPARNEVDELNFARGALGIAMAVVVSLTLLPM